MTSFRVSVTYAVEITDQAALLRAGAAAWQAAAGGWAYRVEDDGVVEATAEEAAAAQVGPEASIAFVLGQSSYPAVPGVRFTGSSVDVRVEPPG